MTNSVSKRTPEQKAAAFARLSQLESVPPEKKQEVSELPRWVKTALVLREVDGLTYREAAARFNKAASTLNSYAKSPAAKTWIASLTEFVEDPIAMAKAYLSANALSVTLERFIFLQAAIDAGDYATGDKIARDLQDRMGLGVKKSSEGAIQVKINLGGTSLEMPAIEAEYEVVGEDEDGGDEDA